LCPILVPTVIRGVTMSLRILLLVILWASVLASQSHSQTKPAPAAEQGHPVIHTTTREVVLDLVVRDKHHHAVTDLRPEEVQVYEDGVLQTVREFRNIQGKEQLATERSMAEGPTTSPTTTDLRTNEPLNTLREVNFVSVVFGEIAQSNLEFARRAVQEFLKSDDLPNTYVTIYRMNVGLQVIQPYTSDKAMLAKAVDAAAKGITAKSDLGTTSAIASSSVAMMQAQAENILASPVTGEATTQAVQNELNNPLGALAKDPLMAANSAALDVSVTLGNAILTQAELEKGLRFVTSLSNGMDDMDALHALVQSEANLPGRKVVLYLSDGLTFPVNRRDVVDDLMSYANRENVTFYTIDTLGLNMDDPMLDSLAAQKRVAAESVAQAVDPINGHLESDDVQLSATNNRELAMRELAESTGGFAVTNTNEIGIPMEHMMEDMRTHYELAYAPSSTVYDGHFRKIEVMISRPKLTVQTRKGYFAVPDINGTPLRPFELLALKAIDQTPAPTQFPYQVAAIKFRPEQNTVEYAVTFEIPLSGLKGVQDAKTGDVHVQTALVALIHDETGAVVGKVSRELARDVPNNDLGQVAKDRILYAEPVELKAGHYVIDAVVTDEQTGKTSVKRLSVFVAPGDNLAVSSLELVRKFEPLTRSEATGPFDVDNGRITPTLADSVASGNPVGLYFVIYPGKVFNDGPKVTLELLQDGREIASKPLNVGAPEADGSIPMFVELSPHPGQCDVLVTARQGGAVAQSSLSLKVE